VKLFLKILVPLLLVIEAQAASTNQFLISFWCGPPPGGNYDAQYADVAECNFTHAAFPCSGVSVQENKAILDACQKNGLKFILSDGRLNSYAPTNAAFTTNLDAILADYAKHPATGGYFLSDESGVGGFPTLAGVNQYLLKKDPARLPFINLLPIYATPKDMGTSNYEAYVDIYCNTVKPRLLCYDHYSLFTNYVRESYFENMEVIRRAGLKYEIPMGFIFLVTPHGTYLDPFEKDLRWQINSSLAYGCKALFYFTYFTITDPEAQFHNGIIDPQGHRTAHYDMAKRLNRELKILGKTLIDLTSTAVYHTGTLPNGVKSLPPDAAIQASEGASLVIGFFKHADGSRWAMVVNRDLQKPVSTTLTFDKKIKKPKELSSQDGKLSSIKLKKQQGVFQIDPGGIKILRLGDK
jgi:hypothetical protein